jgi:hypothetical protein
MACCAQVEESFEASEGAQLGADFKLAKHIGSSSTADVFKLKPAREGKSKGPAQVSFESQGSFCLEPRSRVVQLVSTFCAAGIMRTERC